MPSARMPVYPATCPECQQPTGLPFSAGTCNRPGVIVVKLRCKSCGHEWSADAPKAATPAVVPFSTLMRRHSHLRSA